MNIFAPISTIMTSELITVNPEDHLKDVRDVFHKHNIHHIPVVRFKKIVGLISKTDYDHFYKGVSSHKNDALIVNSLLESTKVHKIMTSGLAKVEPDDKIIIALDIFAQNELHALPVVDQDELVGIITPQDIIKQLIKEVSAA